MKQFVRLPFQSGHSELYLVSNKQTCYYYGHSSVISNLRVCYLQTLK